MPNLDHRHTKVAVAISAGHMEPITLSVMFTLLAAICYYVSRLLDS